MTANTKLDLPGLQSQSRASLKELQRLDYRAPRDRQPRQKLIQAAQGLYLAACRAGDPVACWSTLYADTADVEMEAEVRIGRNCLSGHQRSCDAIRMIDWELMLGDKSYKSPLRDLCKRGIGFACYQASRLNEGDADTLHLLTTGCSAGDFDSCGSLLQLKRRDDDMNDESLEKRVAALASRECQQGYYLACQGLPPEGDHSVFDPTRYLHAEPALARACNDGHLNACNLIITELPAALPHKIAAAERMCSFGFSCDELVRLREEEGSSDQLGLAYERACQNSRWNDGICAKLAELYLRKSLIEPIPGRARELVDYVCGLTSEVRDRCDTLRALSAP